jgi:hypothetical protein
MKRTLRLIAALLAAGTVAFWAATGANRGWTKTHIPIKTMDATTGLEGIQWRQKFVPGIDFLGVAFVGVCVLAGISLFVPSKPKPPKTKPNHESETHHPGSHRRGRHSPRRTADV